MKHVLVVEDDIVLCLLTKRNIELMGHKVVEVVTTGVDAINAVKKHKPDIVLMDVYLAGGADGINTMHEIAKFDDVPVVYFTASLDESIKPRAAKTNMFDFLTKPIDFRELETTLNKVEKKK